MANVADYGKDLSTSKRTYFEILRSELERERSTFINHWRDLSDYILPRRAQFTLTDTNRGDRRNLKIIDSTGTFSARTLRSGMMSGMTSPARAWFNLTTSDPALAEFNPVKEWLREVTERMRTAFLRSNLYQAFPIIYMDMGVFATGAMFMEEDFDNVFRFYNFPIGSYYLFCDEKNRVRGFMREFRMTVRQVVAKFQEGPNKWDNFSMTVRNLYRDGHMEEWVDLVHAIIPNPDYDPAKVSPKFKQFKSCYYEKGFIGTNNASSRNYMTDEFEKDKLLRESGYDFFPVLAPRWGVTGEDVYGTQCPGMDALGDIKALQLMHKRKAQAIDKHVNPPMRAPSSLATSKASTLPGDITYVDTQQGQQGFEPVYTVNPRIDHLVLDIQDHQKRIQRAFYEDLFLMIASDPRNERATAREIDERHEEKLLALGPVLEQVNQDLLDPLIDNAFYIMERAGLIPLPPPELQGQELKVEYVSIMAQAQKLVSIGGLERFTSFVGNLLQQSGDMSVIDKVDLDQMIDEHGNILSISPRIIRSDEDVERIRANRAQVAQAQQRAETMKNMTDSVKNLSQADMGGDTALNRLAEAARAGEIAPAQ